MKKKVNHIEHLSKLLDFDKSTLTICYESTQLSFLEEPDSQLVIVGLDEVGRGCLSGPVVACAVVLPEIDPLSAVALSLSKLNDSKLLAAETRVELAKVITSIAQVSIGEASVGEINSINILQASFLAMHRAYLGLNLVSQAVLLVDGNKKISNLRERQIPIVKGDSKSASIAAASIIAKVHRDNLMCKLAQEYPEYDWHNNKGYGSKRHRQAIKSHGLTPWHRRAFVRGLCLTK